MGSWRNGLRSALAAAIAVTALAAPSAASAATTETASAVFGLLSYTSVPGQADAVVMTDGGSSWLVRNDASPGVQAGFGCAAAGTAVSCPKWASISARLDTLDGDDSVTLTGAPASVVYGGDGNDTIVGGPSTDRLYGDAGNDAIDARDGKSDVVDCGAGDDRAQLDAIDTATNCETDPVQAVTSTVTAAVTNTTPTTTSTPAVPQLPTTLPPVGPATILPPAAPLKITRAGRAPLEITCGVDQTGGCSGVIYIDPAPRAKKSRKARSASVVAFAARRGRFGSSPFKAAPGEHAKIGVKLSDVAMRALGRARKGKAHAARRGRRVKAVVTVKSKKGGTKHAFIDLRG